MKNRFVFKEKVLSECTSRTIGIDGENEQEILEFTFADEFIEGTCFLEIEFPDDTKGFIELEQGEESYTITVKNSLLAQVGQLKMQLKIVQEEVEVWKSQIFEVLVLEAINATSTIEEDYPDFVETTTARLQALERKIGENYDKNYLHIQDVASDEWVINHEMNKYPTVTVIDSANNEVIGEVEYIDENNLKVKFTGSFSGKATLN